MVDAHGTYTAQLSLSYVTLSVVICLQADWSLLINETALDLVVTTFQDSPLTIFVLGYFTAFTSLAWCYSTVSVMMIIVMLVIKCLMHLNAKCKILPCDKCHNNSRNWRRPFNPQHCCCSSIYQPQRDGNLGVGVQPGIEPMPSGLWIQSVNHYTNVTKQWWWWI